MVGVIKTAKDLFHFGSKSSKDHDGGSGCGSVVERSPPTPEIRSLNPVIGKLISNICVERTKIKKKREGMALFV